MKAKLFLGLVIFLAFFLRFYHLGTNPASLYWDEASLGYNAYSILSSGKDEHGEFLPIARFIAFGDFKPPLYIYSTSLSILFFGLTEFSVRFPSALSGILLVLFTYLLSREWFGKKRIALIASFLIAISPWSIQFSRAAFESNLAVLFNLMGIYFFVLFRKKKYGIILSVLFFIFSFYTFNSNRIIAPLLLGALILLSIKHSLRNIFWVLSAAILGVILIFPSIHYLRDRESRVRFQEVSIFNDLSLVELSNKRIEREGNTLLSNIIHNRRALFIVNFLEHFVENYSGRFLFVKGDANPRLSILQMGELYPVELPFILLGIWYLIIYKRKVGVIIVLWMVISVLPAAVAKEVPHALRIASILPSYQIVAVLGFMYAYKLLTHRKIIFRPILTSLLTLTYILCIYYYLHNYYIHYRNESSSFWQYGYKEMVQKVAKIENMYDRIFITDALGRPYIYFAFYNKMSNAEFLNQRVADRDWYGFWTVYKLGKYHFDFSKLSNSRQNDLIVTTPGSVPSEFKQFDAVYDLKGKPVFVFANRK